MELSAVKQPQHAGERVLGVGCGSGNAALAAARRFDVSEDDTLVLQLDYLEAVARKPAWR